MLRSALTSPCPRRNSAPLRRHFLCSNVLHDRIGNWLCFGDHVDEEGALDGSDSAAEVWCRICRALARVARHRGRADRARASHIGEPSGDSRGGDTSYHEHGLARRRGPHRIKAPHKGTFRYLMVMREWHGVFPASVTSDSIKSDLPERVCPDVTENLNNHASRE